jgi:hypothetical protein
MLIINKLNLKDDMDNEETTLEDSVSPSLLEKERGGEFINRVSSSTLIAFDLEEHHTPGERVLFDLKHNLHQEMILREKDLREFIKTHDWKAYAGKFVAITLADLETTLYNQSLSEIEWHRYQDAKVVIKGCSKIEVPLSAYVYATNQLRSVASSIMYGEPCSTVPIFKTKRV